MADARAAWNDAGDKLTELGRKLKTHYEQQHQGEGAQEQVGQEAQQAQQGHEQVTDAVRALGHAVTGAFEAIAAAARDKEVQTDVKQAGQSLVEALSATLGQISEDVRRVLSERKGPNWRGSDSPGAGEAVTTETAKDAVTPAEAAATEAPAAETPAEAPAAQAPPAETPAEQPKAEPGSAP